MEKISIARRRLEKAGDREPGDGMPFSFGKRPEILTPSLPWSPDDPVPPLSALLEQLKILKMGENRFAIEITQGAAEQALHLVANIFPVEEEAATGRKYFTPAEACHLLRVHKSTLYRALRDGSLKGIKIGRQWRVLLDHN